MTNNETCVPPENLPSVISATFLPKPEPIKAEVGFNISGIPGALLAFVFD
jgi:hypothetical protein